MRIADIEFINIENADKTGVGSTLVVNDTLVFFNLHGIKDHELEEILNYKSFTYRSWKEGKKTVYFVFKYGYGTDSKVIYCSAGFSSILIRLLQNKYGYTINGKELYRAREITRLPNMKFSLWDFQKDAIQEWIDNGCYGILTCPTASGKCCKHNTLILTNNGLIKIKNLVEGISNIKYNRESIDYYMKDGKLDDEKVDAISVQGNSDHSIELKKFKILNKYDIGIADTITIKTKIGIEICGTLDHKVIIIDNDGNLFFKMLKDITIEDNIAITYNTNIYNGKLELNHRFTDRSKYDSFHNTLKNIDYMNTDLARLLGYAISEGNVSGNSFIITTYDEEMQNDIKNILKNIGLNTHDRIDVNKNNGNPSGVVISSVIFVDFIRHLGYIDLSKNKEVPWSILQSNKECQTQFMKGIFDGDGTLNHEDIESYNKSEYKDVSTIEYDSSSYELCRQLQIMLLNIGIISRLHTKKGSTSNYRGELRIYEKSYRLSIYGSEALKYAKEIGFNLTRKKEVLNEIVKTLENRKVLHSEIVYPNIYGKLKFEPVKDDNWNYLNELKNKFIIDNVESIIKGKEHVYDMTVDEVHSYIGNCIVNHNSIIGCSIIKKMNVRTIILCHTADLLVNVWFNYLIEQFGEEIKDRIGIIGGGLSNKDRKMLRIIDNDFGANIKKDIVIATSQALLAGDKLPQLGQEHFGLMITDECLPYDTLINTSKGVFKIGELYDKYINNDTKRLIPNMTTKSLDFDKFIIVDSSFIPKKTSIRKMYEIELINGIKFITSDNHKCLTEFDIGVIKYFKYEEIKMIKNIGYLNKQTGKLEFANVINKNYISEEQGYDLEILNKNNYNNHNYFIGDGINVHNCHHYSAEQFKKVSSAIRAAYRCGLSATIHRPDGLSPIFYALLGDVRYRIGIKELVKKGLLVEPIFYSIIIEDEKSCNKIRNCNYKLLEYSRYVKKVSGSSELKFRYILGLCQSLQSKGRKFMLYTDFVNKSGIDENGVFDAESVFTRDDYVKGLLELKIKTIGISSEMSGIQRQTIFSKLGNNELDGIVFGSLGNEGINIPSVDAIIMCNATASTIRFPQRVGRAMRLYKGKTNCYVYEILLNTQKELKWSEDNFLEYEEQGYKKEKIYVNNDGYQIKKEIKQ